MLSAAERVIVGKAVGSGFVSEHDLTNAQVKVARYLVLRGYLEGAGAESDGAAVYKATDRGRLIYEGGL